MTHWYEQPDDQKDLWYWTGVVSSLSLQIGLHRTCTDPRVSARNRKLYKRIGWAAFIRDQLVALGTQRPTRIKLQDHTLPMLVLSDFDLEPVSDSTSCVVKGCSMARDSQQIQNLASTCIEVAKLSLCMGHVLDTQYTMVKDDTPGLQLAHVRMLLPKSSGPESDEVLKCDAELEVWKQECTKEAQHTEIPNGDKLIGQEPIYGHRALLELMYHAAIITLHRPLATSQDPTLHSEARSHSATQVQTAAFAITRITQSLLSAGLIPFMPSHCPTVILQGIMVHLVAGASPDENVRLPAIEAYRVCMQGLHIMRDVHNGADVLIRLIEMGMKQRGALNAENITNLPKEREHSGSPLHGGSPRNPNGEGRRMSTSSEKSQGQSNTDLMAVLGARVYEPPVRRQATPVETTAAMSAGDPTYMFESSGFMVDLMVDEKVYGGWPVAKSLLTTMLGIEDTSTATKAAMSKGSPKQDTVTTLESAIEEEEEEELEGQEVEVLHADFMEYVDEMVDFGFSGERQGQEIDTNGVNAEAEHEIGQVGKCLVVDENGVCIVRDNENSISALTPGSVITVAENAGNTEAIDVDLDVDMDGDEDMATPTLQSAAQETKEAKEEKATTILATVAAWTREDELAKADAEGFGNLLMDIEEMMSACP